MSQDFYADLLSIREGDRVFVLENHFSFRGDTSHVDFEKVSRMCADASKRQHSPGWVVFPRQYAANDAQHSCQILMIRNESSMTREDPRPTREDVQFFRAFIKGWSACNARVRRKRP